MLSANQVIARPGEMLSANTPVCLGACSVFPAIVEVGGEELFVSDSVNELAWPSARAVGLNRAGTTVSSCGWYLSLVTASPVLGQVVFLDRCWRHLSSIHCTLR